MLAGHCRQEHGCKQVAGRYRPYAPAVDWDEWKCGVLRSGSRSDNRYARALRRWLKIDHGYNILGSQLRTDLDRIRSLL